MGWTGGAVGKNSNGNVNQWQPAVRFCGRAGLGFSGPDNFRSAVKRIIVEYVHSGCADDLVFSPELTDEERDAISAEACRMKKFNLHCRSYRKGPAREDIYMVLSLQRTPLELVNYILKNGGKSDRYCLQKPSEVQFWFHWRLHLHYTMFSAICYGALVKKIW